MVLALTAALVAPYFIDWNHYRAAFEREAGRVLGREVQVQGEARARLLPFPSVTFTDVTVAGEEPGAPAMTVEEFSMDAELAPFLRGEVLIFDMRLVRPSAHIALGADGAVDWAVRPSGPFDPRQVTLEKVSVTDGSVTVYHGSSGRTHELTGIDAILSARTLAGPWRINGALKLDGKPLDLSISTGTADPDGVMRVRMEARPEGYPIRFTSDGQARLESRVPRYEGTFTLNTYSEADAGALRSDDAIATGNLPATNRMSGIFTLDHQRLEIGEFRFETGPLDAPYSAEGKARIDLGADPRFLITADGAQLHFESGPEENDLASTTGLEERLNAFAKLLAGLPAPAIPGEVAINLPAIVAGDTTVRDIGLRAAPTEGGWIVDEVSATLPGRTRFEARGKLTTRAALAFEGHMLLAIRQPSGFAAWLARDVDDAIRRLPAAGFSADVALSRAQQSFSSLELALGDARFTGSIERIQAPNTRPSLSVALEGGELGVDGAEALTSLFVSDDGANRLAEHDVDLRLKAGPVFAAGMRAEELDTMLRLRGDSVEIDRLTVGGLAGARLSATGTIIDFTENPTGRLDATLLAVDLAPLLGILAEKNPESDILSGLLQRANAYPGLFSDAEVNLFASAADNGDGTASLAVSAEGVAGGSDLSFSLSGNGAREDPATGSLKTSLVVQNDDAAALYGLMGLPALPLGLAGDAQLEVSAEGSVRDGIATTISFDGDGLRAGFEGTLSDAEENRSLSGRVRLVSDDIEPWMAVTGVTLPGFGLGLPVELSAELEWSENLAVLTGLNGSIAGSGLNGDLNLSLTNGKPRLEGLLNVSALDLAPAAELVLGAGVFDDPEEGAWPKTPFGQSVSAFASADLELHVGSLWAGFWDAGRNASLRLRLDDEGLALSDFSTELYGGRAEGFASLKNNDGTGLLSAQLALDGAALEAVLPEAGLSGQLDTRASVTGSGKSIGSMIASLAGSGSAVGEDLVISGLNPGALPQILERADAIGNEIDDAQTTAFAPDMIRNGRFGVGPVELAFSIANGVARVPPLHLKTKGATLAVDAVADMRSRTVEASGSIVYEAGSEAVVGSEPAVRFDVSGPLGSAQMQVDTEPMAQYLTQRALEREQARVERMQAVLLEKQRLRREARYYAALNDVRDRAEAEQQRLQLELQRQREREDRARAEAARLQEEARRAEEAMRQEEARRAAEEQRLRQEENARAERERANAVQGDPNVVERMPLPPPAMPGGETEREPVAPNSRDAVEEFFKAKNLSVDRLLELIGPEERQ